MSDEEREGAKRLVLDWIGNATEVMCETNAHGEHGLTKKASSFKNQNYGRFTYDVIQRMCCTFYLYLPMSKSHLTQYLGKAPD